MASETQAIDELVKIGQLSPEIGKILKRVAGKKEVPISISRASVFALHVLIDKSPSIWESHLNQAVIDGQNHMLSVLLNASKRFEVWLNQSLFDSHIESFQSSCQFREIDSNTNRFKFSQGVRSLDVENFKMGNGTALYDAFLHGIVGLIPLYLETNEKGIMFNSTVAVLTDGEDTTSKIIRPEALKEVIEYVTDPGTRIISRIILAGVGNYNYDEIARSIGVHHVIHCSSDEPKSIRAAFGLFSSESLPEDTAETKEEGYKR